MRSRILGFGLLTLLLTLLAPGGVLAQGTSPAGEGIGVRGQWTITVVRDGSVVERREFHNDLSGGGQAHVSGLLARVYSAGPWAILVEADGTGTLCADNEFIIGSDTDCAISESSGETTLSQTGSGNEGILLEGTETVVRDANLIIVHTFQYRCLGTTEPANCSGDGFPAQVTVRELDTPIAVQTGDTIEVTVQLSFGTLVVS